ncbi:hypothetical protein MMC19_006412 [Ptychographa xylographoides]|nr:hypothetical protein [Ptychographa xylographoides]
MKSFSIIALASVLSIAAAAPVEKRDIVWFTVTDEVVETVWDLTTIWVPPGEVPTTSTSTTTTSTSTTPAPNVFVPVQTPVAPAVSTSTTVAASTLSVAPQVQPAVVPTSSSTSTSTSTAVPTSTSTSTSTSSSAIAPPSQAPAPAAVPAPAPVSASSSPAPVVAAVSSPTPTAASTGTSGSGGSYPAVTLPGASWADGCTPGSPCLGDMTFYNPSQGMGACGPGPDGYVYQDTDFVVAISHEMMGSESNGDVENPLCWRKLHIFNPATGQTNSGMVVDKCAGCAGNMDIDLSPALYDTLGVVAHGRYHGVSWYWE